MNAAALLLLVRELKELRQLLRGDKP